MDEWYHDYFDQDYLRLYEPHLSPERDAAEVGGVVKALALPGGGEVLDLCCGQGRHSVLLAQRGFRVTGLDLSDTLLDHARERAAQAGVEVEWLQGDMREIPWTGRFDAVINIFTAFGYFDDDAENQKVLDGVCCALKPGGLFFIELMHRDRMASSWRPITWFETASGVIAWDEQEFDPVRGVNRLKRRYLTVDGRMHERHHSLRVYTPTELTAMLRQAGLTPVQYWGGLDLSPLTMSSRLAVLARKQP
jgi:SAM-dependent methyltransferase